MALLSRINTLNGVLTAPRNPTSENIVPRYSRNRSRSTSVGCMLYEMNLLEWKISFRTSAKQIDKIKITKSPVESVYFR